MSRETYNPESLLPAVLRLHSLEVDRLLGNRFTAQSDRFASPEAYNPQQRRTWERSFDSDPDWRLLKGTDNEWMYAPQEPGSEQYKQGKEAMEDVGNKVQQMITPSSGNFDPGFVPMRGGGRGGARDWLEQLHFDPDWSGQRFLT